MSPMVQKLAGWALCGLGAVLALFGAWAIAAYVWGVIEVLGAADQSWIFWGLAILFIGIGAFVIGFGMVAWGRRLLGR